MLTIEKDDFVPRVSLERRRSLALPFSPLLLIDGISRSFSYNKLPQQPLKLSVLKLDDSSFEIEVTKSATVAELKQAVEGVFSHLPKKGPGKVSWPHLWGQFCLCYDGQKLLIENKYIRDYGIKDGDQLQFIRHVAINYNLIKSQSKKQVSLKQQRMSSSRTLLSYEEKEEKVEEDSDCVDQVNIEHQHNDDKDEDLIRQHECRLAHFLRGWFSSSRMTTMGKMRIESKARVLRPAGGLFGGVKKVIRLYSSRRYSQREKWIED